MNLWWLKKIIIEETAEWGSRGSGHFFARFTQVVNNSAGTSNKFDLEAEMIKNNSAANISASTIFVTCYGTMINIILSKVIIFLEDDTPGLETTINQE